ncbi:Uma2 family endonuclease [Armatimonas rosea]|uniref:Uma2 family endonuclease n=1 Tax=Armatimonas rosea TaxID=685828 RepID=A0A7W9W7B2_ARMRO|nr:Uma2 family endonuclease [Armatimonas rosea]MBB6050910.1 Uma2 family endonuclease [Armatimonas rosea]
MQPIDLNPEPKGPWRWSVAQFERAVALGLFPEETRLELLAGELYERPMENPPHAYTIDTLYDLLARSLDLSTCFLRNQHALPLSIDSAPIPDIAVIAGRRLDFLQSHPRPEQVLLVVDVSDATLSQDRHAKAELYAEAGIQEYWIVNLSQRRLEVYRDPSGSEWGTNLKLPEQQSITPLCTPSVTIPIASLLPPRSS